MSKSRKAFCSFCRKSSTEVGPFIEGPGDACICCECVELCQRIFEQEKLHRGTTPGSLPETTFRLAGVDVQVQTREDFPVFVHALIADLMRGKGEGWENRELPDYLEALAAWVNDMDGYYRNRGDPVPNPPTWKSLAEMLMAARVYG